MTAPPLTASYVLGRKLDSIPFSAYHVLLIVVYSAQSASSKATTSPSVARSLS